MSSPILLRFVLVSRPAEHFVATSPPSSSPASQQMIRVGRSPDFRLQILLELHWIIRALELEIINGNESHVSQFAVNKSYLPSTLGLSSDPTDEIFWAQESRINLA